MTFQHSQFARTFHGVRRFSFLAAILGVIALMASPRPAAAQFLVDWTDTRSPDLFAVSTAWFDVNRQTDQAAEFRVEYRADERFWIFKPFGGVMVTTDEAIYGFAGIYSDFKIGPNILITPSFAPGLYEDGNGKDIGHTVEFRSQLEVAYRFANDVRIAVSFNHISNAGLDNNNPGVESLAITYAVPFNALFGINRRR